MIHDIVGNQGFPIVNKNHPPLPMRADFISTPGQFAKPQPAMLMRIAKYGGHGGNGL